jgi:hypothetical protein
LSSAGQRRVFTSRAKIPDSGGRTSDKCHLLRRKKGAALQKKGAALRKKGAALRKKGAALQKKGLALQKKGLALQKKGAALRKKGAAPRNRIAPGSSPASGCSKRFLAPRPSGLAMAM